MSASKAVRQLVDLAMVEHKRGTFSHFLTNTPLALVSTDKENGTIFSYTVPSTLCRIFTGNDRPQVGAATLLALLDELSTYSLMLADKVPRGGVSVQLSTEVIKHCYEGDEVLVRTKSDKVGKAIGFCSMELLTPDGTLLARGKHIKYLPLGRLWDIMASPFMLPFSLWLFTFFTKTFPNTALGKWWYKKQSKKGDEVNDSHDDDVSDVIMKGMVGRKRSSVASSPYANESFNSAGGAFRAVGIVKLLAGDARVPPKLTDPQQAEHTTHFELKVQPHLTNLLRKMHGGAVATAIEEACMQTRWPLETTGSLHVNSMDIRYLSPMKGDLIITVVDDVHSPEIADGKRKMSTTSYGTIANEKGGQVCAQFTCHWSTAK